MTMRGVRMLLLAMLAGTVAVLVFGPDAKEHLRDIDKALAAGKKVDWWDDAALGVRYAAWINLGLLSALLLTSGWWAKPISASADAQKTPWWQDGVRWFWPALLAVTLLGIGLRVPLASKSLWWDESWQMMQASHGRWKQDNKKPDTMVFQQHDWKRAAWYYQKPTNHAPVSVAQKASLKVWRSLTGAEPSAFNDLVARLPALLGSALSLIFLGCLLRSWGRPGAGIAAAMLLALHPWALRYGVDMRGYALVLPLVTGALLAATRLLQSKGENWFAWLGLAVTQALWLWAYPQAVFDLMMLNLALLVLLTLRTPQGQKLRMVGRLAAVNLLAATLFLQAFLPALMQAVRWAGQETVSQPFSAMLVKSLLSHLFLGIAHGWPAGAASAGLPSLAGGAAPWGVGAWAFWAIPLLLVAMLPLAAGSYGERLRRAPWWLLAVPLLGSLLFIVVCVLTGQYFYPRFVISILPVLLAFACLVLSSGKWRLAKSIIALGLVVMLLPIWSTQLKVLTERPIAPLRDVAKFLQHHHDRDQALIACFGHGREIMPLFSADIRLPISLADLQALQQEANANSRPLVIAYGHEQFNQGVFPDAISHLNDAELFEQIAAFPALESEYYYRVFQATTPPAP